MKYLKQTKTGGLEGNCLPTSLACVLDYDNGDDFLQIQHWFEMPGVHWMAELQKYLIKNHGVMLWNLEDPAPDQIYFRGVWTETGIRHQTIWKNGKLLHDTNPFGAARWADGSIHPYDQQHFVPCGELEFLDAFSRLFVDEYSHLFHPFWHHDQSTGPFMFDPEHLAQFQRWADARYEEWCRQNNVLPDVPFDPDEVKHIYKAIADAADADHVPDPDYAISDEAQQFLNSLSRQTGVAPETLSETYLQIKAAQAMSDRHPCFKDTGWDWSQVPDFRQYAADQREKQRELHPAEEMELEAAIMNGIESLYRWEQPTHEFHHTLTLPDGKVIDWKD